MKIPDVWKKLPGERKEVMDLKVVVKTGKIDKVCIKA